MGVLNKKYGRYPLWWREAMSKGWEEKSSKFKHISKEWLMENYINKKLGAPECAKLANCSYAVIYRRLEKFNIPIRNYSESQKGLHIGNKSPLWKGVGKKLKCSICGNNTLDKRFVYDNRNIVCSKECKAKLMQKLNGKEKCHLWRGGIAEKEKLIRKQYEYKNWRRLVFVRDEFTCQDCGQRNIYIEAHHIKSFAKFPELRFVINNGITYCKNCHRTKHRSLNVANT
jgi:5-methylcytosine-specific restriction endonuclease McrA